MAKYDLSEEEVALLENARAEKAKREAEEKHAQEVKTYKELVDEAVNLTVPEAQDISRILEQKKAAIFERFHSIISMKDELFSGSSKAKDGRFTDTFTNKDSTARVTLGFNTNDAYDDTYTAGVEKVKEYIQSLASDDKSRQLAEMVNTLLMERSKAGQLKAQNVLRLESMANEIGDPTFIEGMKIIRDAYRPDRTKQFVKVEVKDASGKFQTVSLNMTNC
ncbi:MAG: DUF3164 family protein [Paludibacteraceae bacterium]|nr:DUF3164 family protein [Paludibacteraceae bacterium]MBQ6983755.1 DUF3164 family protein [Paludibacteraceae bacterium]